MHLTEQDMIRAEALHNALDSASRAKLEAAFWQTVEDQSVATFNLIRHTILPKISPRSGKLREAVSDALDTLDRSVFQQVDTLSFDSLFQSLENAHFQHGQPLTLNDRKHLARTMHQGALNQTKCVFEAVMEGVAKGAPIDSEPDILRLIQTAITEQKVTIEVARAPENPGAALLKNVTDAHPQWRREQMAPTTRALDSILQKGRRKPGEAPEIPSSPQR